MISVDIETQYHVLHGAEVMSFIEDAADQAAALFNAGLAEEALQLATIALARSPDHGRLHEWRGLALHRLGRFALAQGSLEAASLLVPLTAAGQWTLADCYRAAGHVDAALTAARHLAGRADLGDELLAATAALLGRLGDFSTALDVCRRAARRQPEADEPLFAMAFYMQRLGYDPAQVTPLLERAIALEPRKVSYRTATAILLARAGNMQRATELLRGVPAAALRDIRCANCLARLEPLFQRLGCPHEAAVCRERRAAIVAAQLQAAGATQAAAERAAGRRGDER